MCGAGGNAIQFALVFDYVIAIDIDKTKIEIAKHNAKIYGVEDKIEFIIGDFFELSNKMNIKADMIFLDPPWGGQYYNQSKFDIRKFAGNMNGFELFYAAKNITNNIAYYVPKNTDMRQLKKLAKNNNFYYEKNKFYDKIKAITAYYGDIVKEKKKVIQPIIDYGI